MGRRLRVDGSWGSKAAERGWGMVSIVDGPAGAEGRHPEDALVAAAHTLEAAEEIVASVNAARDAAERPKAAIQVHVSPAPAVPPGLPPGAALAEAAAWERRTGRRLADGR